MTTDLLKRLTNHDWFYGYADDHRAWKRGAAKQREILRDLEEMECPYDLGDIRKTVQRMIFEDFTQEDNGYWYRHPKKYKNVAGCRKSELIKREHADNILSWINSQD